MNLLAYLLILFFSTKFVVYSNVTGQNFECNEEGSLVHPFSKLQLRCTICICSNNSIVCEPLKKCTNSLEVLERRRKHIRCIEEECCSPDYDLYENDLENKSFINYHNHNSTIKSIDVYNPIKTTNIRYMRCSGNIEEKKKFDRRSILRFLHQQLKSAVKSKFKKIMNLHQATFFSKTKQNGLCTLSNLKNTKLFSKKQYLTTYDGLRMNFKIRENTPYLLTQDCLKKVFSIQIIYTSVRNSFNQIIKNIFDGISTSNYTKKYVTAINKKNVKGYYSLLIKIENEKFMIDEKLNVKMNRKTVALPIISKDLTIKKNDNYLLFIFKEEIKIIWSIKEIIVSLPGKYQEKTCGLCGNFNFKTDDELINKNGFNLKSPLRFIQTWISSKAKKIFNLEN